MPNVQRQLVDQGVTLTNSLVDFPLCSPYRASLLSGLAAHNHGIKHNFAPTGGSTAFQPFESDTIAVWLKAAGYRTALLGKYINQYASAQVPPGWDEWFALMHYGYFDYDLNDNGKIVHFDEDESDYSTDAIARRVKAFLRDTPQPFFMVVAPFAPHWADSKSKLAIPAPRHASAFAPAAPRGRSFNAPNTSGKPAWVQGIPSLSVVAQQRIDDAYKQAARSLLAVDELLGEIVASLGERLDDTYICFTSDNGYFYGEHRISLTKIIPYDAALKVPLVCRGPGIPAGETRDQLVNNLDLVATIVDWAGAPSGATLDGQSLAPLLHNAAAPWRTALFFSADRDGLPAQKSATGVRTPARAYIRWGNGFEELYDLRADPDETENKAKDPAYANDLAELRAIHDELKDCSGGECWYGARLPTASAPPL
jgi:arylsulfatase A-like enzyme